MAFKEILSFSKSLIWSSVNKGLGNNWKNLANRTATPNANGVGVFTIRTGANAGGKAGQTIVDITGINSGARKEFTLTVSASGAAA